MKYNNNYSDLINDFGGPENTIAAIASPLATGAIGVIRISGSKTIAVISNIFSFANKNVVFPPIPKMMTLGFIHDPNDGRRIDQVEIVYYQAPNSYTGEDVIEIFCHGGLLVMREIYDLLVYFGATPAQPGEFTCRAFLNGKMDLVQAESVLDVINARNRGYLDAAVRQLDGSLSNPVSELRRKLINILAQIEVAIEYSEDSTPQMSRREIKDIVCDVIAGLKKIVDTSDSARLSNEGLKVAIIGKPNVGKSSLMNRLLGKDRVIVSDIPGTTRDLVGDYIAIGGFDFLLMDTAGITVSEDTIEAEGVRRTHAYLERADIVLCLFDGTSNWSDDDDAVLEAIRHSKQCIPVLTKSDLLRYLDISCLANIINPFSPVATSSFTGSGIPELIERLSELANSNPRISTDAVILHHRHRVLLNSAVSSLSSCIESVFSVPDDILSIDIREAACYLGKITGEITVDDVINTIFSDFCVGK
jgi:tRNA modification GTPase